MNIRVLGKDLGVFAKFVVNCGELWRKIIIFGVEKQKIFIHAFSW